MRDPLRIGIDATAVPETATGVGTYVYGLIRGLAEVDGVNQYTIFGRRDQWEIIGVQAANMRLFPVTASSRIARVMWEQTLLPIAARRLRLDVLHSPHYTMPVLRSTRSVVTFHDLTFQLFPEVHERSKRYFFGCFMRVSARWADLLIAVSENTKKDMVRLLGVSPSRVVVTPEAASSEFRPLPLADVANVCSRYDLIAGRYLLYVGVLEPRKNVPMLLKSYAAIHDEFPQFPLVLAGKKGWMYDSIFERVNQAGISDALRFVGHVPKDDLVALYNGARAFVYPSKYEGFGLPVLEAMQCGTPVVAGAVSSIPEIAGDAAILIDPSSAEALTDALRRILADEALAVDLAARGRARAAMFSWNRCARETIAVYQRCATS